MRLAGQKKSGVAVQATGANLSRSERHARHSYRSHPWIVIHACELARDVLPLLEGQLAAGMRPSLLTPTGAVATTAFLESPKPESLSSISLLHTWNHVREWRSLMNESAAESSSEILHAHSFSSGMAAVRASSCVVYQLKQPVEKMAAAAGHCRWA